MGNHSHDHVDNRYPHSEIISRIIAAAQQVHYHLGPGFREVIYQRALALELRIQGLTFSREGRIPIHYRGTSLAHSRVDFIVEEVLVEIKGKAELEAVEVVQTLSYLKAAYAKIALLLNFGARKLASKRLIQSESLNH